MTGMMLLLWLIPVVGWSAPPDVSGPPDAQPWEWTPERRIQERYDPAGIEGRRRRAAESQSHGGAPIAGGVQVIDGRDDPELFFEWELFDALLSRGYGPEPRAREIFREIIEANLATVDGFEMPADFWQRLASAAEELLASRQAQRALAAHLPEAPAAEAARLHAEIDDLQADDCRRRRLALLAVRKELGRESLLRILYQGVAPDTFLQESTDESRGEILRYVQRGCS